VQLDAGALFVLKSRGNTKTLVLWVTKCLEYDMGN
jgi:hypothetical protein